MMASTNRPDVLDQVIGIHYKTYLNRGNFLLGVIASGSI